MSLLYLVLFLFISVCENRGKWAKVMVHSFVDIFGSISKLKKKISLSSAIQLTQLLCYRLYQDQESGEMILCQLCQELNFVIDASD